MSDVLNRNIVILFFTQLIFVSGTVLTVTVGGIVGNDLSPDPALATLPLSFMVIGTALTTIPATMIMQRIGRRLGFTLAAVVACGAALLAAYALETRSFVLYCVATASVGMTLAFSQQFRFAAAESVPAPRISYAISFILLGSIGGAFLGPELAARSQDYTPGTPFLAAMLVVAALYAVAFCLSLNLRINPLSAAVETQEAARPLRQMVAAPLFIVAVLGGVVGQGVLTFIMTATPLSMHAVDGHNIAETASVIRAHVIAMYLPSLISAPLISRFGEFKLMTVGALALLVAIGIGLTGQEVMHYWGALLVLGIGWNFLFVGGTTLLVSNYRPSEKFRAQAVNEFSVFGVSAVASLLAGVVIVQWGWPTLLLSATPAIGLMLVAIAWASHNGARGVPATSAKETGQ